MQFTARWIHKATYSRERALALLLEAPDGSTLEECRRIAEEMRVGIADYRFDWGDSGDFVTEDEGSSEFIGVVAGDPDGLARRRAEFQERFLKDLESLSQ
jgi:hypothetical protein